MTSKTIDFENADKDTPEDVIRGHSGMAWNICNVGEEGTCVIFGHGNRKHLKPLKDVELGETIKIKSQGTEYLYLIELIVSSKTMNSWQYRLQQGNICWFQLVIRFITQEAHHRSSFCGEQWNKEFYMNSLFHISPFVYYSIHFQAFNLILQWILSFTITSQCILENNFNCIQIIDKWSAVYCIWIWLFHHNQKHSQIH